MVNVTLVNDRSLEKTGVDDAKSKDWLLAPTIELLGKLGATPTRF